MESRTSIFSLALLLSLLLFISCTAPTVSSATSSSKAKAYKAYVAKACNNITTASFSTQCAKSLSPYANKIKSDPKRLCKYALSAALVDARAAKSKAREVLKTKGLVASEKAAMKDCADQTGESVDQLKQCQTALKKVNGSISAAVNAETVEDLVTWASAALTDDETCTDELDEEKVGPARMGKFREAVAKAKVSASVLLALITYVTSSSS